MGKKELSPREEEIVALCVEGLTNEGIANKLGIGIGTVNTYWLRIKLKVGGSAKTDTVVRVIKERAEKALKASDEDRKALAQLLADKHHEELEARAALALFHFAMNEITDTAWATDQELTIHILANGENPSTLGGVKWEVGKTVYEIFQSTSREDLAVAAHLKALSGVESEVNLVGNFKDMVLRVIPLVEDEGEVMGCISVLGPITPAAEVS